ncbi:scavenger receptor cysteine-rich domain-containing group B protein-like [Mytilus trossulus]|uniref:scavenger receptor cysteine-rich domain-containing group B protein-like n=1 Tax=Mytilus trossulus TaxID=6551 RepID=UPI00300606E7
MWFFLLLATFILTDVASTSTGRIRLVNGTSSAEGRLEIYYNGTWGTVCDDLFDWAAAFVVCRQLGFRTGFSLGSTVSDGNGTIWLDNVHCNGTENRITECQHLSWGVHNCGHHEDVGVYCLGFKDICGMWK